MSDWHPLANDDPFPGNPEAIRTLVSRMRVTETTLSACADRLGSDDQSFWVGPAGTKFKEERGNLPKILKALETRYHTTGEQLAKWADLLESSERGGVSLLDKAQQALQDQKRTLDQQHDYVEASNRQRANNPSACPITPDPVFARFASQVAAGNDELHALQRQFQQLLRELTERAQAIANVIREVCDDNIKNKGGLLGFLENVVAPFLESIDGILDVLSTILTVVAFVGLLASVAIPGLGVASLVLAGAILASKTAKYLDKNNSSGDRRASFGDVALAALSFAGAGLSVASSSAEAVAAASKTAKGLSAAERAAKVAKAERLAENLNRGKEIVEGVHDAYENAQNVVRIADELASDNPNPFDVLGSVSSISLNMIAPTIPTQDREVFDVAAEFGEKGYEIAEDQWDKYNPDLKEDFAETVRSECTARLPRNDRGQPIPRLPGISSWPSPIQLPFTNPGTPLPLWPDEGSSEPLPAQLLNAR